MIEASRSKTHYDVVLASQNIPKGWMIGPRSFLMDRIEPALEHILLPETKTGGGSMSLEVGEHLFAPPRASWHRRLLRSSTPNAVEDFRDDVPVVDLRANRPENWAHFLNNHLTILAIICRETGRNWREFKLLLPKQSPKYLRGLAELLGLNCIFTDACIRAQGVNVSLRNLIDIRGERFELLNTPEFCPVPAAVKTGFDNKVSPAQKLFIGRKDTRKLINQDEIMGLLRPLGFESVYAEDLGVPGQLEMLTHAEQIVAVHGAALAPTIFRPKDLPRLKLVELFPVGHVTNCYRAFSAAMQAPWCGVRGHIPAGAIREVYNLDQAAYTKHSLNDFTVDVASVAEALDIVAEEQLGAA